MGLYRLMRRRLAVLLITGWVILSCFDVLEDLEFPNGPTLSQLGHDPSGASHVAGWGALANNIVESAHRIIHDYVDLLSSTVFSPVFQPVSIFRPPFQLHKLYRKLLI
jgi:hypothetical protein